ncbi:Arc-like DNA binding domain-containing protein [Prauserella aidingensis]|uniref:FitA-like ribbon-helix-helix domain-containing protein n=1 Tax=Prauserella aidingensis TaxID=387890 RepID=UPI0020A4F5DD|nr:Arc family DNA-binding protein [Prauserella aidingensis]MCP2252441.1 Arc-like DNA binding domain-containing protein [Prauserella aidingensis]
MATLTIRDFDDDLKAELRVRAAEHGRSMESEVRAILASALAEPVAAEGVGTQLRRLFGDVPEGSLELPSRDDHGRTVDLPE